MAKPIELYYWPTPNGLKISIALEEMQLKYELKTVNINKGDQFKPEFLAISPNNRMPAIVDPDGPGGKPISIFESGAILQYLGRKSGKLYPRDERKRVEVEKWLFWQVGGLGPMAGQANFFRSYASKLGQSESDIAVARERYINEVNRLFGVLEGQLSDRPYVAGEFSIADIASWPWVRSASAYQKLDDFPNLKIWFNAIAERQAVKKALADGAALRAKTLAEQSPEEMAESAKNLFGQTARSVAAAAAKQG